MTTNNTNGTAFEVGKVYGLCSPFTILKRTAKTVTYELSYTIFDKTITETYTKRIKIDDNGNEYVPYACNSSEPFQTKEEKEAAWRQEEEARLEAERKERAEVKICNRLNLDAPLVDDAVIMAWCMQNDIKNLVDNAKKIRMISCGICANPEMNSTSYGLTFEGGMYVIIEDRHRDKEIFSFCNNIVHGEPCVLLNGQKSWKIEPTFDRRMMTIDKDGVWTDRQTGEIWTPSE